MFADLLTRAFNEPDTEPDAAARPLATEQGRYAIAILAVAALLKNLGQDESADKLHLLSEALQDLADGIRHPFFKIERPAKKGGRSKDTSAVWRIKASVCIGLEFLIASGMTPKDAIVEAMKDRRKKLAKLLRPGTAALKTSLESWRVSFADGSVTNERALDSYKLGISPLKLAQHDCPGKLQQAGKDIIAKAAERASRLA